MSDITKCASEGCGLADKCWRKLAPHHDGLRGGQSYADFLAGENPGSNSENGCEHYWRDVSNDGNYKGMGC